MKEKRIEGIGVFMADGSFVFDSGMPAAEPVLESGVGSRHGVFNIEQNASATFVPETPHEYKPPVCDDILKEERLSVKRTTRNFIVKMKFPIFECSEDTTQAHKDMWKKSQKAITNAREEIKKTF